MRCLRNERLDFPVLEFPDRATTSPCGVKTALPGGKNATHGSTMVSSLYSLGPRNPKWKFRIISDIPTGVLC